MANPTLVAFAEKDSGTGTLANGSGETTASLSWQIGDILVLFAVGSGANAGNTFNAPSNTGSGIAWGAALQNHVAASDCEMAVWGTTATAASSGTVTVTLHTGATGEAMQMGVYQYRAPGGTTIALGNTNIATGKTTTQHVVALTMSSADSSVCWASGDFAAAAIETVTPTATTHSNVAPGPTASPFALVSTTNNTGYISVLDDEVSIGSINFGTTGTTGGPFDIIAVEIKISGATVSTSPQRGPLSL